jgi:hypothetical protein
MLGVVLIIAGVACAIGSGIGALLSACRLNDGKPREAVGFFLAVVVLLVCAVMLLVHGNEVLS